jgi:hypothetical protein
MRRRALIPTPLAPDLRPAWTAPRLFALTSVARVAAGYSINTAEDDTYAGPS